MAGVDKSKEFSRSIKVDEKSVSLKPKSKESKKLNEKAARGQKHSRSKTMPLIKRNFKGKPLNVSFERFSNGHKFFTELKSNKNKVS